jgi:hypothetical protein
MSTEHSEASRKGTKGDLPSNVVDITTSCGSSRSLGNLSWGLKVTLRRAIDFEILMSLPEDNGTICSVEKRSL